MAEKDMYHQLAEVIGAGNSRLIPAIMKEMADEKEMKLVLAASPPATVEELAEKTEIPKDEVQKLLDGLFTKGLIYKSKKPEGTKYYRVRHLIQFHDATILTPGLSKDVLDMWKEFDHEEWPMFLDQYEELLPKPGSRVIPVNVSVESESKILAFEDVRSIVEEANRLAVVNCTCRLVDGKCGKPVEVCIQINKAADYTLERGTGRELSKQEAIDMLKMCEEEGLVHITDNRRSIGNLICNCCEDCCINWPGSRKASKKFVAPSRFVASVDEDLCTSCEVCLDRCYFDAITMTGAGGTAQIDEENCMGCGLCIVTCDSDAMSLKETRSESFVEE
ncbi:MAG: helix-turn-helix domain-containing protein [Desulfobacterales bacterium]